MFVVFTFSGCDHCEQECPRCIAADDFGIPKGRSAAFFEKDSDFLRSDLARLGLEVPSAKEQVLRWKDSGYVTSGETIDLVVRGKWAFMPESSSLRVSKSDVESVFRCGELDLEALKRASGLLQRIFPQEACTFEEVSSTDYFAGCFIKGEKIEKKFSRSGCILEKGHGLYLLFKRNGDEDPNTSFSSITHPKSPVMHVGYTGDSIKIDTVPMSDCTQLKIESGWRIYYKILDRIYQNNVGGYSLEFRTGVIDPRTHTQFFESVRSTLQKLLTEQNKAIYNTITSNNDYIGLVKALIVLVIVLMGLKFLLGMSEHPASELLVKVLQMAIILQLISPSSWDFFYNNLFRLFIDGLNEVIAVVNSHTGGSYQPDQPFAFLDRTVNTLFEVLVSTKVRAILLAYPLGVFWWLILFFVLVIYVILVAYAFVVYMTALVGLSVLIVLMPILFLGMLFGQLKHTFDNWFTQALSFCFQAIMIFTLVSLFSAMVKDQFYRNLGYTVCCNRVFSIFDSTVYAWTPGQKFLPFSSALWSSKRVSFTEDAKIIDIPPDYDTRGCRFEDYPFYDPGISDDNCKLANPVGAGYDWTRIKQLREADSGLLDFGEVFILLLLAVIMYHMRDLVQSVGAALVGASPFQAIIGGAYAASDGIGGLYRTGKMLVANLIEKVPVIGKVRTGIDELSSMNDYIGSKIASKLNEVQAPRAAVNALSVAGDIAGGVARGATYLAGMNSDLDDHYYEKMAFKNIHYTQALMGYHLGAVFGDRSLGSAPGINILRVPAQHICDRYVTGRKDDDLFQGLKKLYVCEREKLQDYYLGVKKETLGESAISKEKKKSGASKKNASKEDDPFGVLNKAKKEDIFGSLMLDSVAEYDHPKGDSMRVDDLEMDDQLTSQDTSVEDLGSIESSSLQCTDGEEQSHLHPAEQDSHDNVFIGSSDSDTGESGVTVLRGFGGDVGEAPISAQDEPVETSHHEEDATGMFEVSEVRSDSTADTQIPTTEGENIFSAIFADHGNQSDVAPEQKVDPRKAEVKPEKGRIRTVSSEKKEGPPPLDEDE
ncbi:trbL/VirB6 plasmid conjugal transfer family protein [Neorickettsia helminthoeca str. Oregon]|uniref:TrbL/VirB6 plasmid conjugal transfer family protein n=2 Tax=Neorickettsia helminthoeca TaxID=33994 RepID=X5H580_9RICK|nr:trbL/VirB6 plasmid conjugal transfer family protein [Neorickettsia helminthoeca str. Oregon]